MIETQNSSIRKFNLLILVSAIAACLGAPRAFAQIQNPLQAAKDASNKAKQQQQKGQQQTAPPASSPHQPVAQGSSSSASSGDCCSPEAMRKIAASDSFLDIVGIKLGMTPEQAVAAIKTYNPKLKIDLINTRMVRPGVQGFTRVPRWIVAHTVGAGAPNFFADRNGSAESIGVEFTTPPNPPMVGKVFRWINFPRNEPVAGSTLVDALHKKYGPENSAEGINWTWIFDASGKQLTRFLTPEEKLCQPSNPQQGFPLDVRGGSDYDGTRDQGGIDLDGTSMNENSGVSFNQERRAVCQPYAFVMANVLLQDLNNNMMVTIQSPGLFYVSWKATHDWLQKQADAKIKQ